MSKKLISVEEHNKKIEQARRERERASMEPTGIACSHCGSELHRDRKSRLSTLNQDSENLHCLKSGCLKLVTVERVKPQPVLQYCPAERRLYETPGAPHPIDNTPIKWM